MKSVLTRFRAFQLGSPGSSFSYFADGHFTLLEGRLTALNRPALHHEMGLCGVTAVDTLHITSWDADHCDATELEELLALVRPARIECPGYEPHSLNGGECQKILANYVEHRRYSNREIGMQCVTPEYIAGLASAVGLGFRNIMYNPLHIDATSANDNSTVEQFRKGSFNLLSLGDVESPLISARLRRCRLLQLETDVMILAHHGADNGFTTRQFVTHLEPSLAVCSADYDNLYEHPRDEIRKLLHEHDVRLMTTKTGDVIVESVGDHNGDCVATNLKANSTEISSRYTFVSKKAKLLSHNADTIRQIYRARPTYPRN